MSFLCWLRLRIGLERVLPRDCPFTGFHPQPDAYHKNAEDNLCVPQEHRGTQQNLGMVRPGSENGLARRIQVQIMYSI